MCDSTVAGQTTSPTPFLGRPLQHSAGRGWGGETESVCHCRVTHGISVLTLSPKNNHHKDPYRGEGCLVLLPRLSITCACKTEQRKPTKNKKQAERDQTNRNQTQPYQRTTTAKKKKNRAGAEPRGRCRAGRMGRTRSAWPRRRDTRGIPNPKRGLGFPAPEKERKRESGADEHTEHKRKREGTTNIWHTGVRS